MKTQAHLRGELICGAGVPARKPRARRLALQIWGVILLLSSFAWSADQILMTLRVESSHVKWEEDFVLTLEIYEAPAAKPPDVTIQGMDQFVLKGHGQNLLQIPGGKTAKWILTYTLTPEQSGSFPLGPAIATINGKRSSSNTLFITVEGPPGGKKPKPEGIQVPIVHSAAEIGNKVLIVLESDKKTPYVNEGATVRIRLLSQLPVENLRFKQEADFPGFFKYDFPVSSTPQAQKVNYEGAEYAAYELQKFLLFPLTAGKITIPAVSCDLRVRVPSGKFPEADLMLDTSRNSNTLPLNVRGVPQRTDVVGDFSLRSEIVNDGPDSKTLQLYMEGDGQLSTFDFPALSNDSVTSDVVSSETKATIRGDRLHSQKTTRIELRPRTNTTSVVLRDIRIQQFNPATSRPSSLVIPAFTLRFIPPASPLVITRAFPELRSYALLFLLLVATGSSIMLAMLRIQFRPRRKIPGFSTVFSQKNTGLPISRVAAQKLYRQISREVIESDSNGESLVEILKRHVPQTEWLVLDRVFRKLEWNAFSSARVQTLTYREIQEACTRIRMRWQQ